MRTLALAAIVSLAGCDALAEAGDRTLFDKVVAARERMHTRHVAAANLQTAISFGDLVRARADAQIIAGLDESETLSNWSPYFDDVRTAAEQVAAAPDTITLAKTFATLGLACARCHTAVPAR